MIAGALTLMLGLAQPVAQAPTPPTRLPSAMVQSVAPDSAAIELTCPSCAEPLVLVAADTAMRLVVSRFGRGDSVAVAYVAGPGATGTLVAIQIRTSRINSGWLYLAGSAAFLFLLSKLLLRSRFNSLVIGADNRYSNSKFQVTIWFFLLMVVYLATTWRRMAAGGGGFIGGVNIPANLLFLSGLSALTFAAAKGITVSNIEVGKEQKNRANQPRFPFDLFHDDDNRVDLADFQMIIITFIAVAVYLVEAEVFLRVVDLKDQITLKDVDTTILATFGLGQGAYLAKKYVGDVNPGRAALATAEQQVMVERAARLTPIPPAAPAPESPDSLGPPRDQAGA